MSTNAMSDTKAPNLRAYDVDFHMADGCTHRANSVHPRRRIGQFGGDPKYG